MSNDMNKVLALDNWALEGSYIKQSQVKAKELLKTIDNKHKKLVWAKDYFYREQSYMEKGELKIFTISLPDLHNIGIEVDKNLKKEYIINRFIRQCPDLAKYKLK